jgi:hypothetical protein
MDVLVDLARLAFCKLAENGHFTPDGTALKVLHDGNVRIHPGTLARTHLF